MFAHVYDATIAPQHYKHPNRVGMPPQDKHVVVKCPHKKRNFEVEREFLKRIRSSTMQCSNIMTNIATIVHSKGVEMGRDLSDYYILYEKAEMDLEEYIMGPRMAQREQIPYREQLENGQPFMLSKDQLIQQAFDLSGAVRYIHQDISERGKAQVPCAHFDLKLDNILVRYFPGHTQQIRFMISDFGISKPQDIHTGYAGDQPASFRASDWRPSGRHTGPDDPRDGEHHKDAKYAQRHDVFALATIICYIMAFAIGGHKCSQSCNICGDTASMLRISDRKMLCGPHVVRTLDSALKAECKSLSFHNPNTRLLKGTLLSWFDGLDATCDESRSRDADKWIKETIKLLKLALDPVNTNRPLAKDVESQLSHIDRCINNPGHEVPTLRLPAAVLPRQSPGEASSHLHPNATIRSSRSPQRSEGAASTTRSTSEIRRTGSSDPMNARNGPSIVVSEAPSEAISSTDIAGMSQERIVFRKSSDPDIKPSYINLIPCMIDNKKTSNRVSMSPCGKFVAYWSRSNVIVHRLPSEEDTWFGDLDSAQKNRRGSVSDALFTNDNYTIHQVRLNAPLLAIVIEEGEILRCEVREVREDGNTIITQRISRDVPGLGNLRSLTIEVCRSRRIVAVGSLAISVTKVILATGDCEEPELKDLTIPVDIRGPLGPDLCIIQVALTRDGNTVYAWARNGRDDVWLAWNASDLSYRYMWKTTPKVPFRASESSGQRLLALQHSVIALRHGSATIVQDQQTKHDKQKTDHLNKTIAAVVVPNSTALVTFNAASRLIVAPMDQNAENGLRADAFQKQCSLKKRLNWKGKKEAGLAVRGEAGGVFWAIIGHPSGVIARVCLGQNETRRTSSQS